MSSILPLPQTFPLVKVDASGNGFYTVEYKRYLDDTHRRMGGVTGGTYSQLTDEAIITWDLDLYPRAFVILGGNRALVNPTNMVAGIVSPYRLNVVQDGTGNRLLSWGSAFKFSGGTPPTLSPAANAVDEFWFSSDGTTMRLVAGALDLR